MVEFIDETVRDVRDNPTSGNSIELIIGVADSQVSDVRDKLREIGVESITVGPFNTLLISAEETAVPQICDLSDIREVETNSKGKVLAPGN